MPEATNSASIGAVPSTKRRMHVALTGVDGHIRNHGSIINHVISNRPLSRHWVSLEVICQRFLHLTDAGNAADFQSACGSRQAWINAGAVLHNNKLYLRGAYCEYNLADAMKLVAHWKSAGPTCGRALGMRLSILLLKAPSAANVASFYRLTRLLREKKDRRIK